MDNYNYPMGADTPDAPWNQEIPEMEKYDVEVNYTLTPQTDVIFQKKTKTCLPEYRMRHIRHCS